MTHTSFKDKGALIHRIAPNPVANSLPGRGERGRVMLVTAHLTRYRAGNTTEDVHTVEVDETASISDLINLLPTEYLTRVEVERYYKVQNSSLGTDDFRIQFVIRDGVVVWMPSYDDTRLDDFFATFDIRDNTIFLRTGISGRGGGELHEIISHWQEILSALSSAFTMLTAPFFIRDQLRIHRGARRLAASPAAHQPAAIFSLLVSRRMWNPAELAILTQIPRQQAKELLRLCRYSYDKRSAMYVETPQTTEAIRKLNNLSFPQRT